MNKITSALFVGLCLFASLRFCVDIFEAAETAKAVSSHLFLEAQSQAPAEGIGKETNYNRRPVHTKVKALCADISFQEYELFISYPQINLIFRQTPSQATPSLFQLRAPPALI